MNDEAVYRTAPATPGLLIIIMRYNLRPQLNLMMQNNCDLTCSSFLNRKPFKYDDIFLWDNVHSLGFLTSCPAESIGCNISVLCPKVEGPIAYLAYYLDEDSNVSQVFFQVFCVLAAWCCLKLTYHACVTISKWPLIQSYIRLR